VENLYQSPELNEPSKKKSSIGKWVLFGCSGCLIASLLLLGSCFLFVKGAMKAGENKFGPTCDVYLAHVNSENYTAAYDELDQDLKNIITPEKHHAMHAAINRKLGHLVSKSVQNVHTGFDQTGSWAKIDYSAKFTNGDGTVRFGLKKRNGQYKIIEFNYNSPLLLDLMIEPKQ
jgi:hypothetical protein